MIRTFCRSNLRNFLVMCIGVFLYACGEEVEIPNAPEGFVIHPEFQLDLVASEPLVYDPVDMEFDASGNAFVLEMPGYPKGMDQSRLILLKDENGDGKFDRRILFADSLNLASSILPYKEGVLVAGPPELIYVKDNDGDGVADDREVLMEGFKVGNLQHNYNGLTYGLDNWIYAGNGGNNGAPHFAGNPKSALDLRGNDFKFHLEEKRLELVGESSGGFELAFDNWGRMFQTHNLEHVSQLVFEGKYTEGLRTEPDNNLTNISDHEENGLSRIFPIGEQETRVNHPEQSGYFSGACGITFYGGGNFPKRFNNNIFVADVVLNLIHLDLLSETGAISKASRNRDKIEFLASTDRSFRPVNLTTGPDGSLYVIDMYRASIEHPEWIPDEIENTLNLDAGKEKGRIYRIIPRNIPASEPELLAGKDIERLVVAFESKNQWVRMTAQRLLIERNDPSAVTLLKAHFTESRNPLARLHCLWTLEGMDALADDMVLKGLQDTAGGVKENACLLAESRLNENPAIVSQLLLLLKDEKTRVRMRAMLTLSTLEDNLFENTKEQLSHNISRLLKSETNDPWIAIAATTALRRNAEAFLVQILQEEELNTTQLSATSMLAMHIGRQENVPVTRTVIQALTSAKLSTHDKVHMLESLAEGWDPTRGSFIGDYSRRTLYEAFGTLEHEADLPMIKATAKLRRAIGLGSSPKLSLVLAEAQTQALDTESSIDERLVALELVELDAFYKRRSLLFELIDNKQPLAVQQEAMRQLSQVNDRSVAQELLKNWSKLGPETRKTAGNILLYKAYNHDMLLTALEDRTINPGELNLDLERRRVLLFSKSPRIKGRAEALFSDAGVVTRKAAIASMRPALRLEGDPANGKTNFQRLCSSCHQYGKIGQQVGPVLTEINRKSKEALLYEILDPNAACDTQYLNHTISTQDGNIYVGIVASESDTELRIKMNGGEEKVISKQNISEFSSLGISFMPEGLEKNMTLKDMADLLAFLQEGE